MQGNDPKLLKIWTQKTVPVVYNQGCSKPLLIRLPFAKTNRSWLKATHKRDPTWDVTRKRWETPRSWYEDVVRRTLNRFGQVYVIQPFHTCEKCAPACWKATGIECECSCMGANHGSEDPPGRWYIVSEACAVSWGKREYSCRLIAPLPVMSAALAP